MGTIIVSLILLSTVTLIIRSMIKAKKSGNHPSCGGNCNSCGHACSKIYPHINALIEEQKNAKIISSDNC